MPKRIRSPNRLLCARPSTPSAWAFACASVISCGGPSETGGPKGGLSGAGGAQKIAPPTGAGAQGGAAEGSSPSLKTLDDFRKKRILTLGEARRFMQLLVNRDRATMGLSALPLDEGAAQASGDEHARDMAASGYLGHMGLDGSTPDVRFARHGGRGVAMENCSCVTDEAPRGVVEHPTIDAREIEEAEDMYFHEQPPNDGHRKTILRKEAVRVAIGIAQPRPRPNEIVPPCTSQEFIGPEIGALHAPEEARVGDEITIEGEAGATRFGGVGIVRLEETKVSPAEANRVRSFTYPAPSEMFFPRGFKTRIPVQVKGHGFSLKLPLRGDAYPPGLYEISTWGEGDTRGSLGMTGLRLLRLR